jgi:hypothetical protein
MRRSSPCTSSCAPGSRPEVGPAARARAVHAFCRLRTASVSWPPRATGQSDCRLRSQLTYKHFPARGEMAEWSKAHPC